MTRALLNTVDGRTITRFDGSKTVLHTRGAQLVAVDPTLREEILDRLTDPNLAVLVLVVGGLLIYVEFNTPGTIIPGTLGTIMVVLATLCPEPAAGALHLGDAAGCRVCVVDPGGQVCHATGFWRLRASSRW